MYVRLRSNYHFPHSVINVDITKIEKEIYNRFMFKVLVF